MRKTGWYEKTCSCGIQFLGKPDHHFCNACLKEFERQDKIIQRYGHTGIQDYLINEIGHITELN